MDSSPQNKVKVMILKVFFAVETMLQSIHTAKVYL